jgi:hypothetical protein
MCTQCPHYINTTPKSGSIADRVVQETKAKARELCLLHYTEHIGKCNSYILALLWAGRTPKDKWNNPEYIANALWHEVNGWG